MRHLLFKTLIISALSVTASVASAAPSTAFKSGNTEVTLSPTFTQAAQSLGVALKVISPAKAKRGKPTFPITAGVLDYGTAKGEISHAGGLRLTAAGTVVDLRNFVIETTSTPQLTGLVLANGSVVARIPLFDIALPALALPLSGSKIKIPGAALTLSNEAAAALNSVFSVSAFAEGLPIGTATVSASKR